MVTVVICSSSRKLATPLGIHLQGTQLLESDSSTLLLDFDDFEPIISIKLMISSTTFELRKLVANLLH